MKKSTPQKYIQEESRPGGGGALSGEALEKSPKSGPRLQGTGLGSGTFKGLSESYKPNSPPQIATNCNGIFPC